MASHILEEVDNIILVNEGHLAVDLSELRLTVSTQVLVAETFCNLEVAVEATNHEQLLQSLRTLRKSVELSGVHARRHNKVACALRCGTDEDRSLYLDEVLRVEEVADKDCHAVTQLKILAHCRTAQVEVAILHTDIVATVSIVLYSERRCNTLREDIQFLGDNLDIASRQISVLALTLVYYTSHLHAVFASQFACTCAKVAVVRVVEDKLCDTIAVAKVDECHTTHLASALYPSGKCYGLAAVRETKLSACIRSIHYIICFSFFLNIHAKLYCLYEIAKLLGKKCHNSLHHLLA